MSSFVWIACHMGSHMPSSGELSSFLGWMLLWMELIMGVDSPDITMQHMTF